MTFDTTARTKLLKYLETRQLASGLGTEESACSVAAINLAISGELTDEIPGCMSIVVGQWIIKIQDAIPSEMRNSDRYKAALIKAAGSGRNREKERFELIMNWMWIEVLPCLQDLANKEGYGREWRVMCQKKTAAAALAAAFTAYAARAAYSAFAADAAAFAADAAVFVVDEDAAAVADAAAAYAAFANTPIRNKIDPIGLLEKLVSI